MLGRDIYIGYESHLVKPSKLPNIYPLQAALPALSWSQDFDCSTGRSLAWKGFLGHSHLKMRGNGSVVPRNWEFVGSVLGTGVGYRHSGLLACKMGTVSLSRG